MTMVRDSDGVLRTISAIQVRDAAGDLRTVSKIEMRDADNMLRTVSGAGGFSVSLSPATLYRYGYNNGPAQFTTGLATVTATGGVPPYTATWNFGTPNWSAVSPSSLASQFRSPFLSPSEDSTTLVSVEVQDANGNILTTNEISAYAQNTYGV